MTDLEQQVQALRTQLEALAERVRTTAVAEEFLAQQVVWRDGDVFSCYGEVHKLIQIYDNGKWLVCNMSGHSYEPHVVGAVYFADAERLYTAAEVAEIVAKTRST